MATVKKIIPKITFHPHRDKITSILSEWFPYQTHGTIKEIDGRRYRISYEPFMEYERHEDKIFIFKWSCLTPDIGNDPVAYAEVLDSFLESSNLNW